MRRPLQARYQKAWLEYLEIVNFKSYGGRHVLGPLRHGINCIVGPNGSGKSNLMDALCFALAVETKHLRGTKMSDFAHRRESQGNVPASHDAEVSLRLRVVTTEHHAMDLAQPPATSANVPADPSTGDVAEAAGTTVAFTRRVVDGKQSQYLVNRKVVDRETYFRQLGNYSIFPRVLNCIVSQGRVEALSMQTDQERSQLIDEVSGSALYREKYETLRKDYAQAARVTAHHNQTRQFAETEARALKAQLDELLKWEQEEAKMKALEAQRALFQLFSKEMEADTSRTILNDLSAEISEKEKRFGEIEEEIAQSTQKRRTAQSALQTLNKEEETLQKELEARSEEVQERQRQVKTITESIAVEESRQQEVQTFVEEAVEQYQQLGRRWTKVVDGQLALTAKHEKDLGADFFHNLPTKKKTEFIKQKGHFSAKGKDLEAQLHQLNRQLEEHQGTLSACEAKMVGLRADRADKQTRVDAIDEQLAHWSNALRTEQEATVLAKEELGKLSATAERCQQELGTIENRRRDAQQIESSFRWAKDESRRAINYRKTLERLQTELGPERVFNNVAALCDLTNRKFAVAVSSALGLQAESVVVDNWETGKDAIELLREWRAPPMEFLPLSDVRTRSGRRPDARLRGHPDLFVPILDVVRFDAKFQTIYEQILEDTVVVPSLEQARRVAFQESRRLGLSLKIVTEDGQTISKNCTMRLQGARQGQLDRFAAKERDAAVAELESLRALLAAAEEKWTQANRAFRDSDKHVAALELQIAKLEQQISVRKRDADALHSQLAADEEVAEKIRAEIYSLTTVINDLLKKIADTEAELRQIMSERLDPEMVKIQEAEEKHRQMLADFQQQQQGLKDLEAQLIQELDTLLRRFQIQNVYELPADEKMLKLETAINEGSLITQLNEHIVQLKQEKGALVKQEADASVVLSQLKEKVGQLDRRKQQLMTAVTSSQDSEKSLAAEKRSLHLALTQLAYRKVRADQADAEISRQFLDLLLDICSKKIPVPVKGGTLDDLSRQLSGEAPMTSEPIAIDYDQAPADWQSLTEPAERLVKEQLMARELTKKKEALGAQPQNHQARTGYEQARERIAELDRQGAHLKEEHRRTKQELERIRVTRKEKHLRCFQHTKTALQKIYGELTKPPVDQAAVASMLGPESQALFAKHFSDQLGGSATLELEDPASEEPFSHGVLFTAMPLNKRYTEMELLSGGEKSMATLALLFSLQSFRPSPFVILDEVDAALDVANVEALRRYLHKAECQIIIVTLKEEMYTYADAIIGVFKDQVAESSGTITLDLSNYSGGGHVLAGGDRVTAPAVATQVAS